MSFLNRMTRSQHREISARGGKRKAKKGFAAMSADRLKEVSRKGNKSRWKNNNNGGKA